MKAIIYNRLKHLILEYRQKLQYGGTQAEVDAWDILARPNQREPLGDWRIWLILAGRGFGKTRTGAQTVRKWALSGRYGRLCLVANSFDDARRIMIEGESGILSISKPGEVTYQRASQQLAWCNGAKAWIMSAQTPNLLRGPQFDAAWVDEFAKFSRRQEVWDQLTLSLRLGKHPKMIVTTTPQPCALIKKLLERSDVVVTRGTTYENPYLCASYIENLESSYKGTRLAAQEIQGHLLTHPGWLTEGCVQYAPAPENLEKIVVAIDPAVNSEPQHAETGIIVAGRDAQGQAYILDDLSLRASPKIWLETALAAYKRNRAHSLVAEANNGGQLIESLLQTMDTQVCYTAVHALKDKKTRAQPALHLYEQGRVFHVRPFLTLESQLIGEHQTGNDRVDALVWALDALFKETSPPPRLSWVH